MTYASTIDVRNALTPAGGPGTAGSLTDGQLLDAILEADQTIDTYLEIPAVHTVEMEEINQEGDYVVVALAPVRFWSRNIAAYLATLTYRRGKDLSIDDPVRLRYTSTLTILTDIRDGKTRNPIPLTPDADESNTGGEGDAEVFNQYSGQLFSADDFALTRQPSSHGLYYPPTIWPG